MLLAPRMYSSRCSELDALLTDTMSKKPVMIGSLLSLGWGLVAQASSTIVGANGNGFLRSTDGGGNLACDAS